MALIGQALAELKIFETGGQTTNYCRWTTEHTYPLSSAVSLNAQVRLKSNWRSSCFSKLIQTSKHFCNKYNKFLKNYLHISILYTHEGVNIEELIK